MFSGIGAIEYALKRCKLKSEIVFASDIDKFAKQSYFENYDSRVGNTTGFHLSTAFKYRYRQLRMSTGIEYNFLNSTDNEQDYSLIYLRIKRLF